MPVVPSQSGYFWGALGSALQNLPNQYMQYQKLQQDQKAQDLRAKMLDLQTQALTDKLAQEKAAEDARNAAFTEMQRQVPMGGPVNGPADASGQMPQQPPQQYRTQSMDELRGNPTFVGNLYKAQPKEATNQLLKNMFPTAGALHGGFDTIEEAQAAAAKAGIAPRVHQLSTGKWAVDQIAPVNPGADLYHRTFQQGKAAGLSDEAAGAAALAELRKFNFGNSAATGAGGEAGKAGQFLGEPAQPFVGVQGMDAPKAPVAAAPGPSSLNTPNPAGGTFPTPSTGTGTPAQRMARGQAEIKRQEQAVPGSETDILAKGGQLDQLVQRTRDSFKPEYLGRFAGPTELEMRRRFGGQNVGGLTIPGAVSPGELVFRQNLDEMKNLIVYLMSGKQINESEAQRLQATLPQPYEKDAKSFNAALDRFQTTVRQTLEQHRSIIGQSRGNVGGLPPPPPGWR